MNNYQEYLTEVKAKTYELYYNTSSSASQAVFDMIEKAGYTVDEDDWFEQVNGTRKPSVGKTNSFNIGLLKNGKPVKKQAVFQIYNRDNKERTAKTPFELNYYIS